MRGCGGGGCDRRLGGQAGGAVAVDEAAVADGQGRQRCSVDLGLVVGGDRQARRCHLQRSRDIADRVVGVGGAGRGDRVAADVRGRGGGGRDRRLRGQAGRRVAVDEAAVADGQGGQRRAVQLRLVVGAD